MVVFSGLPLFSPEDVTRDNRVDLKDVILQIRDFSRSSEQPGSFTNRVGKVIETFSIVAGLRASFRQAAKAGSTAGPYHLDLTYLTSSYESLPTTIELSRIPELSIGLCSIPLKPDLPPPRSV